VVEVVTKKGKTMGVSVAFILPVVPKHGLIPFT